MNMMKGLLLGLFGLKGLYAQDFTHTYYYQVEDRRAKIRVIKKEGRKKVKKWINNPFLGKKNHLLGTLHIMPFERLPYAIKKNIKRHRFLVAECVGDSKPNDITDKEFNFAEFQVLYRYNLAYPPNYFSRLSAAQQQHFKQVLAWKHPDLARPQGMFLKQEGRNLKLNHFYPNGLYNLYMYSLQKKGMDFFIGGLKRFEADCFDLDMFSHTFQIKNAPSNLSDSSKPLTLLDNEAVPTNSSFKLLKLEINNALKGVEPITFRNYRLGAYTQKSCNQQWLNAPSIKGRNLLWLSNVLKELRKDVNYVYAKRDKKGKIIGLERNKGQNNTLITMGAGHLFGDSGMLRLLQKSGFYISRAKPNGRFVPYLCALDGKGKPIINKEEKQKLIAAKQKARQLVRAKKEFLKAKRNKLKKSKSYNAEEFSALYNRAVKNTAAKGKRLVSRFTIPRTDD